MCKEIIIALFCIILYCDADSKCKTCNAVVSDIKADKGLAYMAELSTNDIENYIKEHVDKRCSGDYCSDLVKQLIEIADQLDDDLDSTPNELCLFAKFC